MASPGVLRSSVLDTATLPAIRCGKRSNTLVIWAIVLKIMETIDISKLDKAEVLAALYNASKPQGLGILHFTPEPMTRTEAAELLKTAKYFDYLKGRVMKVKIEDQLKVWLYDRDNGNGAAAAALAPLQQALSA